MKSLGIKIFVSIIVILIFIKVIYSFNIDYKRGLNFDHTIGNIIITILAAFVFFMLFKWFKK
jgi:protein-S-isoprenylcysteine O-methyltransferase Ste14